MAAKTVSNVPCPFCGATSIVAGSRTHHGYPTVQRYNVRCTRCNCRGPLCKTPEEAVAAWEAQEARKCLAL
jgi:hypothetical protein